MSWRTGDELIVLTDVLGGSVMLSQGISPIRGLRTGRRQCADAAGHGAYAGERHGYPGADYTGNTGSQGRCVFINGLMKQAFEESEEDFV